MQHLLLDLYGCATARLADEVLVRQCLDYLPTVIGMQASPVFLEPIQTSSPQDDGLSGFVIAATGHVSLHAWPAYGMVNLDVFSSEVFDADAVVAFVTAQFASQSHERQVVERATRSPRHAPAVSAGGNPA
jgi:S-adenosylmethionine decarboxylase